MEMNGNELALRLVCRRVVWASGAALCIDSKEGPLVGTASANANVTGQLYLMTNTKYIC